MVLQNFITGLINIGLRNGLVLGGIKPSFKPILTYRRWCSVGLTRWKYHMEMLKFWNAMLTNYELACIWTPWWRYQTEIFSALLVLCEGKPSVTGEFGGSPSQRSVFSDLRLNNRFSKHSARRWFETHRTHYDVIVMANLPLSEATELLVPRRS